MNPLPQSFTNYRSPRARLDHLTPAVLRLADGRQSRAELRVISATGGLLSLPRPLDHGSRVKLMFLTQAGTVLGGAEMLHAVSWGLQPFRFVSLAEGDQCRLKEVIHSSLQQKHSGDDWLEKHRARSVYVHPPRKRLPKALLAALALATAILGSAVVYCGVFLR